FYRREMGIDASGSRLWELVADDLSRTDRGREDLERIVMVLARRRASSREFFATSAGEWERMRAEIYGDRSSLIGLLGGWDDGWVVGDLGCGTGHLTMLVAPFVKHVIAVDAAAEMLDIARERAVSQPNVEFRTGELERLPLDDCSLDVVLFALVLQNVAEPEQAVREASRVLRPAGRMLIIDAMPHDREELRRALGNVWQGFSREQIAGWCAAAGFRTPRYVSLPLDPAARGPALFVATSRRP
ncbi:MAG: class I SAM-dependent methyltransferase, partial [Gemmatimonadaceae bacterium]